MLVPRITGSVMRMLRVALLAVLGIAVPLSVALPQSCSGCGCRGGPGYRGPNGHCVGWDALKKTCGVPPTTHCKAEQVNARPDDEKAAPRPEPTTERRPPAPSTPPRTTTRPNPF